MTECGLTRDTRCQEGTQQIKSQPSFARLFYDGKLNVSVFFLRQGLKVPG